MSLINISTNKFINFFKFFDNRFIFISFLIRIFVGELAGVALFPFGMADDLLMLDYASKMHYLSPNVNSLVKTMSFPILLDVVHLSRIPWTIWYSTIWFFAAIVVYILSKKLFKNKYLPLFFYTYVLFFYSAFTVSIGLRVYRNCIIPPFVIITIGLIIILIFNIITEVNKYNIFTSIILGICFTFTYYIKEDGMWLLCVLLFAIFLTFCILIINKYKLKNNFKKIVCLLIPILIFVLSTNIYKLINLKFFGVYEVNTRTEGEYGKFINNIYKIESDNRNSYCWAPYDAIEKAFENSKTLSENKHLLDGILTTNSFALEGDIKKNPIPGDFLSWVLRYELERAGLWTNEKNVNNFFKKVNDELKYSFKMKNLKKDDRFQILSSAAGLTKKEIISLFPLLIDNMKTSIFLSNIYEDKLDTRIFTYEAFLPILDYQLSRYAKILNMPKILNENYKNTIKPANIISDITDFLYRIINTIMFIVFLSSIVIFIKKIFNKKFLKSDLLIILSSVFLFLISVTYAFCISWFINFLCIDNPNNKNLFIIFYNTATAQILVFVYIFSFAYLEQFLFTKKNKGKIHVKKNTKY